MKRILSIITITLAALTFSPRAHAEGGYFGIRMDGFIPIANNNAAGTTFAGFVGVLPLFGIQGGYDFGESFEPGFGVRGTFRTLFIISEVSIEALFRIPDPTAGTTYFGVGGDLVFVIVATPETTIFGAHAVIGYEFPSLGFGSFFLEAVPGFFGNSTGALYYISLAGGFNFRF